MPLKLTCIGHIILAFIMVWPTMAAGLEEHELTTLLETWLQEADMPGLRAAVRLPDGTIVRAAVGLGDLEAGIAMDHSTPMPGGSTGKTFVAVLTMLLAEEGFFSLDDPASRWLGETAWYDRLPNADTIRVKHLLSHSAGIKDYPNTVKFWTAITWRALRHGSASFTPEELIGYVLDKKPLFPAGQGYHYSDAGYLVLGRLLEAATGEQYYNLLAEHILEPLQLDEISVADRPVLTDIFPGYTGGARNLKKDGRMKFDPSSEWTGGGLSTNPTMLVRFMAALAEGRIISTEKLNQMLTSGWQDPATPGSYYGFGLFIYDGGNVIGHEGLWPGYRTAVYHDFINGITVAVQTNRDGRLALNELSSAIHEMALQ